MGLIAASLAVAVIGVAVSVTASVYAARQSAKQARAQGKAQKAMSDYNASVAENQAIAERQSAEAQQLAATEQSKRQREENKQLKSRQTAAMAASGATISGTALLVEEEQAGEMRLQELDILHSGSLRARQHEQAAMGQESSAVGSRFQGRLSKQLSNRRAKSAILSGYLQSAQTVGSAASSYSAR